MKKKIQKTDILLLGIFLVIGLMIGGWFLLTARPGATVEVSVAGETMASFPLNKDITFEITGVGDGINELVIRDGRACVQDANCPDGLCVGMGWIHRNGQSIICLPHQVVVRVVEEGDVDVDNESLDAIVGGKRN